MTGRRLPLQSLFAAHLNNTKQPFWAQLLASLECETQYSLASVVHSQVALSAPWCLDPHVVTHRSASSTLPGTAPTATAAAMNTAGRTGLNPHSSGSSHVLHNPKPARQGQQRAVVREPCVATPTWPHGTHGSPQTPRACPQLWPQHHHHHQQQQQVCPDEQGPRGAALPPGRPQRPLLPRLLRRRRLHHQATAMPSRRMSGSR